jgi:hypothetical protein
VNVVRKHGLADTNAEEYTGGQEACRYARAIETEAGTAGYSETGRAVL